MTFYSAARSAAFLMLAALPFAAWHLLTEAASTLEAILPDASSKPLLPSHYLTLPVLYGLRPLGTVLAPVWFLLRGMGPFTAAVESGLRRLLQKPAPRSPREPGDGSRRR